MTIITNWLKSILASSEGLSGLIYWTNLSIAGTIALSFVLTVVVIVLSGKKERLERQEIAEINRVTAETNKEAGQLRKDAEELKKQNLEMAKAIAPRFISGEQKNLIVSALKPLKGHVEVTWIGDIEARQYAMQIFEVLKETGWAIQITPIRMEDLPTYGLFIFRPSNQDEASAALIEAFQRAEIPLTATTNLGVPIATIKVGFKLPPGIEGP